MGLDLFGPTTRSRLSRGFGFPGPWPYPLPYGMDPAGAMAHAAGATRLSARRGGFPGREISFIFFSSIPGFPKFFYSLRGKSTFLFLCSSIPGLDF